MYGSALVAYLIYEVLLNFSNQQCGQALAGSKKTLLDRFFPFECAVDQQVGNIKMSGTEDSTYEHFLSAAAELQDWIPVPILH